GRVEAHVGKLELHRLHHHRHRDQEDDEEHQHDVDQRRRVDVRHRFIGVIPSSAHRHVRAILSIHRRRPSKGQLMGPPSPAAP
nr:hypothetical protein [Tanacetum cinerariifolium]